MTMDRDRQPVLLGLGANLEDRAGAITAALAQLQPILTAMQMSRIYETAPLHVTDQPAFLNLAVRGETALTPQALLQHLKALETHLGRQPGPRWGPRAIDIDILFYGTEVLETSELNLPHPRISERAFVLVPAAEIAPEWCHPTIGKTLAQLLAALPNLAGVTPWPLS